MNFACLLAQGLVQLLDQRGRALDVCRGTGDDQRVGPPVGVDLNLGDDLPAGVTVHHGVGHHAGQLLGISAPEVKQAGPADLDGRLVELA